MHIYLSSIALAAACLLTFTGCSSIPTEDASTEEAAKQFAPPPADKAGIYVYRDDIFVGSGVYKDVYIDGVCLGETIGRTFFYKEVEGNQIHEVATESEFSPNAVSAYLEGGRNYFFRQYTVPGIFVSGGRIEQVSDAEGMEGVKKFTLGIPGTCSSSYD